MTTVRRRVLRPPPEPTTDVAQLAAANASECGWLPTVRRCARWLSKLRRAFNTVDKLQARIIRLERQLAS